jgi:hypothetical protein
MSHGLTIILIATLSTAFASPPEPTLAAPPIDPPAPTVVENADNSPVGLANGDQPPAPPSNKAGRGLIIGGALLLTLGGAAALSGATMLALAPESFATQVPFIGLPILLPGLGMIGGGVAMVVEGHERKRAQDQRWDTQASRPRLSPIAAVGHRSGYVGFALRF